MDSFKISPRGPLFFMHIPKTAGMSMRLFLRNQYHVGDICPAVGWRDLLNPGTDPARYRLVQGHFNYNLRQVLKPETKVLTIFREPIARTVSSFKHLQRDALFHADHSRTKNLTLSDIICRSGLLAQQRNVQTAALCAGRPPAEVIGFLNRSEAEGRAAEASELEAEPSLELALERLEALDFVGLADDLGTLMQDLSRSMLYHPTDSIAPINQAPPVDRDVQPLTNEACAMLEEFNDLDKLLYGAAVRAAQQRRFERAMTERVALGTYARMQGSFKLDLAGPVMGAGWYEPEFAGAQVWRWTGPDRMFTIEVPLASERAYRIVLRLHRQSTVTPDDLTLVVNGRTLPFLLVPDGGVYIFEANLPKELLRRSDGCCGIAISVTDMYRAAGDLRPLGVAVSSIIFEAN